MPLPNIDVLVDVIVGYEIFFFTDDFISFNQIRMPQNDAKKSAFRNPMVKFYYSIMLFGLQNAGTTY